jgi:hypothetical protein
LDEAVITVEKKHKRRHDGAGQSRWHVVGDIPGLEANHAAPGGVAEVGYGGGLFGAGFHTTLDAAPTFSITTRRRHPRSSMAHRPGVSR